MKFCHSWTQTNKDFVKLRLRYLKKNCKMCPLFIFCYYAIPYKSWKKASKFQRYSINNMSSNTPFGLHAGYRTPTLRKWQVPAKPFSFLQCVGSDKIFSDLDPNPFACPDPSQNQIFWQRTNFLKQHIEVINIRISVPYCFHNFKQLDIWKMYLPFLT